MTVQRASIGHLVQMIARSDNRYALFLGAGASRTSGIPTAFEMAQDFRRDLQHRFETDRQDQTTFEAWLEKQPGFEQCASDYGTLFSVFEPKRAGRQRHIADLVRGKGPPFGYFCLSQLIERHLIGPVLTTNFDDLIWDACARFTLVRPLVLAYGAVSFAPASLMDRPQILKLHGDFLYSSLVNIC
jgi:hypothetical protein